MGQIQGRVLDSSVYGWISDVTVTLATATYVSRSYVDGSLATRDAQITDLYARADAIDVSIVAIELVNTNQDTSIAALDVLTQTHTAQITNLDTSRGTLEILINTNRDNITTLDSNLTALNSDYDASILRLEGLITNLDTSRGTLEVLINTNSDDILALTSEFDASISALESEIARIDAYDSIQDTSISSRFDYDTILDVSIGLNTANLGVSDASIAALESNRLLNTTDTFTGVLTIDGSIILSGDLYQDGSSYVISASNLDVSSNLITVRKGAVTSIADGSVAGLFIEKADGATNVVLGATNDALMRVGWDNDTLLALAAREDAPTDTWYAFWDDASAMFKTYDLMSYINSSLGTRDTNITTNTNNIAQLDASTIRIDAYNLIQDASILLRALISDTYDRAYIDASLNAKTEGITQAYVDGSLASRDADIAQLDASIIRIDEFITDLSTRVDGIDTTSIDASITRIDASIDSLTPLNTSLVVKTAAYTLVGTDNNKVIDASGTWTLTLPDNLDTGFQFTVVNAGVDTITIDASVLMATDGSTQLQDQYAMASGVHKGSGYWYLAGNLKG